MDASRAVAVVHARGAQRAAAQGRARARRSSGVGVGVLPARFRRVGRVSGHLGDAPSVGGGDAALAVARPAVAADSEAFAAGEPRQRRAVREPARSVAPVRRPPWPAGAVVVVISPTWHRRYVINSRQNYSQAAHTRVWGLRRPRAGGRARAQRAGVGSIARRVSARGRALVRLSPACIMHAARARVPRGAGGVGGASRARPRRRTAPL